MEDFVELEAYDTFVDREQIMLTRQVGGRQMQQMLESGKVKPAAFSRTHAEPSSSWTWTLQRSSSRCWPR